MKKTAANPIGQRLKLEMKKRGITSAELAKRADVKTSFIYDIISGKSANPSTVKLARVAQGLGVSLSSLVGSDAANARIFRTGDGGDYVSVPHIVFDLDTGDTIATSEPDGSPYSFHRAWLQEHLGAAAEDLRLMQVDGDSMEPTLYHHDVVLLDTSKKMPSPPGIFVVFDGCGLVAKRLEYLTQHRPPRVRVISDNPQYSSYERSIEDTFIIGRVVWFAREM